MKSCLLLIAALTLSALIQTTVQATEYSTDHFTVYTRDGGSIDSRDNPSSPIIALIADPVIFQQVLHTAYQQYESDNVIIHQTEAWSAGDIALVSSTPDGLNFNVVQAISVVIETLSSDGAVGYTCLDPYQVETNLIEQSKIWLLDSTSEFMSQLQQIKEIQKHGSLIMFGAAGGGCGQRGCDGAP